MDFNPVIIEKGLTVGFARAMAEFLIARNINPGLLQAAMEIPSTSAYEKLGWLGAFPAVQQWIGELSAKEFADYDYTVKNLDWVAAVPIKENDVQDDQTGVLSMAPSLLASRIMAHPSKLMVDLMINGDVNKAYDGVAFFSDATGARTIDNLLAGTGVDTIAHMEADLDAALLAMAKFTDDQSQPLNIQGNLIVCPVAAMRNFKRIILSMYDPNATTLGVYNPYKDLTVIGDPRLDADDVNDWYLLATNEMVKPFVFSNRQAARPGMEKKNGSKTWIFSADYRGNGGYGIPHLAIKTVNA